VQPLAEADCRDRDDRDDEQTELNASHASSYTCSGPSVPRVEGPRRLLTDSLSVLDRSA
jgi:hypothetical protein